MFTNLENISWIAVNHSCSDPKSCGMISAFWLAVVVNLVANQFQFNVTSADYQLEFEHV